MTEKVVQFLIEPVGKKLRARIVTTHRVYHCEFTTLEALSELLNLELREYKEAYVNQA